jgi:hypothetical protein
MSVFLTDYPWGRPVLSSCSSYFEQACRVEQDYQWIFLKPMMVGGRQCIVVMHESGLVMRADKFGDLIV